MVVALARSAQAIGGRPVAADGGGVPTEYWYVPWRHFLNVSHLPSVYLVPGLHHRHRVHEVGTGLLLLLRLLLFFWGSAYLPVCPNTVLPFRRCCVWQLLSLRLDGTTGLR